MMSFPWKSALVTGASAGIGEAITRQLAGKGVHTVAVARRGDRLAALAAEFPDGRVEVLAVDLATQAGLEAVGARAESVDLLVNNAGFGSSGPFVDTELDRLVGQIELNVAVLTVLCRRAAPKMVERGSGWILNVSSLVSFQPSPNFAVYAASKAYVTSFSESLAAELAPRGVVVTVQCPGLTRTEFHTVSSGDGESVHGVDRIPALAWQSAEAVAIAGLEATAKGKLIAVPGALNRVFAGVTRTLPRQLVHAVARRVTVR